MHLEMVTCTIISSEVVDIEVETLLQPVKPFCYGSLRDKGGFEDLF